MANVPLFTQGVGIPLSYSSLLPSSSLLQRVSAAAKSPLAGLITNDKIQTLTKDLITAALNEESTASHEAAQGM